MSDLHKLVISASDGTAMTAEVTLDGQPLRHCQRLTLYGCAGDSPTFRAVLEFDPVAVEYHGMTEVVGKIVQDE